MRSIRGTDVPTTRTHYRLAVGLTVATVLLLAFGIGALGIIGDGGSADRWYAAVPVVLALGSLVGRFRPRGMALALVATALTQALVTLLALVTGQAEGASVVDVLGINAMFATLFGLAAWLFARAAAQLRR